MSLFFSGLFSDAASMRPLLLNWESVSLVGSTLQNLNSWYWWWWWWWWWWRRWWWWWWCVLLPVNYDLNINLVFQRFEYFVTMTEIYNVSFIHNLLNQRVISVFYLGRRCANRVRWIFQAKLKVLYNSMEIWLGFF